MTQAIIRSLGALLLLALLAVPTTALAQPAVTAAPSEGPAGTIFVVSGTGFGADEPLFYRVVGPAASDSLIPFRADESGRFSGRFNSSGYAAGAYRVEVRNGAGALFTAAFVVTTGGTSSTPPPAIPTQCFPAETGKCVRGRFLQYWQEHGGLAINGYPISDEGVEVLEDGRAYLVQYFERVRLEHHPENPPPYDVLLGQFGRRLHPADPPVAAREGYTYFEQTGHNVGEHFLAYWQRHGALEQFGFPLSEEFEEELEDGNVYLVQYFERARFEYHPDNAPPYDVLLGQFGRRIFAERGR